MKALACAICILSMAAGALVGLLEHRSGRSRILVRGASIESPQAGGAAARRPDAEGSTGARGRAADEDPAEPEADEHETSPSIPGSGANARAVEEGLARLRQLLEERKFADAKRVGETLIVESVGAPMDRREELARLAAKARAYERLLGPLAHAEASPKATPTSGTEHEVLLANGRTVAARKVEVESNRYLIHLATGGTYAPSKEDVLEVRTKAAPTSADDPWKRLEAKVSKLEHPLDLFAGGVERCYRLGLEDRGVEILDRILALRTAESDQVPLVFVPDADAALLSDWRVASGRERPKLPGPVGETARSTPRVGTADTRLEDPGASTVHRATSSSAPDAAELVKAAQLVAEAQVLYQAAAGKEGREADLEKSRERLDRALEILDPQPEDEENVRRLRRQIAQLLSDVARASPF